MAHYGVVDVEGVLFRLDLDGLLPRIDLPANLPQQAGQQHVQRQFRVGDNGLSDGHRADAAQLIPDLLRIVGAGRLWPIACAVLAGAGERDLFDALAAEEHDKVMFGLLLLGERWEELREGKECVSTGRSGWLQYH